MQKITVIISNIPDELIDYMWKMNSFLTKDMNRTDVVPTEQVYIDYSRNLETSPLTAELSRVLLASAMALYCHQTTKIKRQ